jgi:molecular chaperone DnaJ
VDGEVEQEIKPGTQPDTKLRLRGKGVPFLRNKSTRGDHYVTLAIQVPTRLNEDQKEALRAFDDAMTGNPSPKKKKGLFG